MSATTLSINWTAVKFTPSGGTLTPITRVQSVSIEPGGKLLPYRGDADRYPTGLFAVELGPKATVKSNNINILSGFNIGDTGPFTATLNDAKNGVGVGGGGLVFALANAVVSDIPISGDHAQFGVGTLVFEAYSADGTTSPLTVTAL